MPKAIAEKTSAMIARYNPVRSFTVASPPFRTGAWFPWMEWSGESCRRNMVGLSSVTGKLLELLLDTGGSFILFPLVITDVRDHGRLCRDLHRQRPRRTDDGKHDADHSQKQMPALDASFVTTVVV